jgi:phosphoribosylformimino-5-aminoimidazole carboxamide ribotide isomerase
MNNKDQFTVLPAIDLRAGKVVRLIQGDRSRQKTYYENPGEVAQMWIEAGAIWLHVVNLDGAFGEKGKVNQIALKQIINSVKSWEKNISIQFGGGLRSLSDVEQVIDMGVKRVVLGTAAVNSPKLVSKAIRKFDQERIGLALDARHGHVHTHGWEKETPIDPILLGKDMFELGIRTCVYTNIEMDGGLSGVDLAGTKNFAESTKLNVIASGGISSLDEIRAVRQSGLFGVIIGKALYEGKFKLEEALSYAR